MTFDRNIQKTLQQSLRVSVFMWVCSFCQLFFQAVLLVCYKVGAFFETQCISKSKTTGQWRLKLFAVFLIMS